MHQTIWSARIRVRHPEQVDSAITALWQLGTLGIEESPDSLCAYFDQSIKIDELRRCFRDDLFEIGEPISPIAIEEPAEREPILVGRCFAIVPSEDSMNVPNDRVALRMNAAMAFGSGRHETTQLCIEALEHFLKTSDIVFDIGCGSGILALAAQQLGAAHVVAVDFDADAIAVARRYFSGLVVIGSADCLAGYSANLILCNITPRILDCLAFDLKRLLKPDGILVLSGFTDENPPKNFVPESSTSKNNWQCWICRPQSICASSAEVMPSEIGREWWQAF